MSTENMIVTNPVDCENALWGKDIYTTQGLVVRAAILKDTFPEIETKTNDLIKAIDDFEYVPLEEILKMNQRVFSRWVDKAFFVINKATILAKEYLSHEKDECPALKIGERDAVRVALISCYKNQTDTDIYDSIDNIIFVVTDIALGFSPAESCFGTIAKYIVTTIKKYNTLSITEVVELLKEYAAPFILDYNEDNADDVFPELIALLHFSK